MGRSAAPTLGTHAMSTASRFGSDSRDENPRQSRSWEMPDAFRTDTGDVASGQPLEIDLHPYAICRIDG